ncbi:MAG: endonuclease III [Bacteroidota bacterium]
MTKKERYEAFIDYFMAHQPNPTTELIYANAFELLVAVVLSAQCTDKRINKVTPLLFTRFPTPAMLAEATQEEVYHLIRTVSYPNNKAKHLIQLSKKITQHHQGKIPQDVQTLQTLPGVGRKTAHVIAATLYDKPTLGVDTHVFRVAKRLGLARPDAKTPLAVEKQLLQHLQKKYISKVNHWLVLHGRYICKARKPLCEKCPLTNACAYFDQLPKQS